MSAHLAADCLVLNLHLIHSELAQVLRFANARLLQGSKALLLSLLALVDPVLRLLQLLGQQLVRLRRHLIEEATGEQLPSGSSLSRANLQNAPGSPVRWCARNGRLRRRICRSTWWGTRAHIQEARLHDS